MAIVYKSFPVGPLQCNCTIIGNTETGLGYVIDPGGDADTILEAIRKMSLTIKGIFHTHAHLDHFLASAEIKDATAAPIYLHEADRFLWDTQEIQCQFFNIEYKPAPPPDHKIEDEQDLELCSGKCIHTPGHTLGSVSFYFENEKVLVAGDTLFLGSVGRTDLPGGDFNTLKQSIQKRLYSLDETTLVIPGHGPETTIGQEMTTNMFVKYNS